MSDVPYIKLSDINRDEALRTATLEAFAGLRTLRDKLAINKSVCRTDIEQLLELVPSNESVKSYVDQFPVAGFTSAPSSVFYEPTMEFFNSTLSGMMFIDIVCADVDALIRELDFIYLGIAKLLGMANGIYAMITKVERLNEHWVPINQRRTLLSKNGNLELDRVLSRVDDTMAAELDRVWCPLMEEIVKSSIHSNTKVDPAADPITSVGWNAAVANLGEDTTTLKCLIRDVADGSKSVFHNDSKVIDKLLDDLRNNRYPVKVSKDVADTLSAKIEELKDISGRKGYDSAGIGLDQLVDTSKYIIDGYINLVMRLTYKMVLVSISKLKDDYEHLQEEIKRNKGIPITSRYDLIAAQLKERTDAIIHMSSVVTSVYSSAVDLISLTGKYVTVFHAVKGKRTGANAIDVNDSAIINR